jgi:sulfite exporter TauE/SafE/copper chaperone CopZ
MEQRLNRKILKIEGMTCTGCERRIENAIKKLEGVLEAKAIFNSANVYITYDASIIELNQIIEAIESLDYRVKSKMDEASAQDKTSDKEEDKLSVDQLIAIGAVLFAIYVIIKRTVGFNFIPKINQSMGYGVLFVVGMLTSLHCIAMCGGINLSQCVSYKFDDGSIGKFSKLKPSLLYNIGRVISYTVIGGIVGALGSVISFPGAAKGLVAVISGVFMIIMGLNMLSVFPALRKLNPRMPKFFGNKVLNNNGKYGPFYIGLLNGLMPCGPLQAMQLYALGTGSLTAGALSMFMFSMGTIPLMFGLGAVSSVLKGKFTHKMMKVSSILVIVLGLVMANRGLALSGINFAIVSSAKGNIAKIEGDVQVVTTKLQPGSYTPIVVQKGIPVKWTIKADKGELNGCNNPIVIPQLKKQYRLNVGDNVIEFTPDSEGIITYTCWMGMIKSSITVVSDLSSVSDKDIENASNEGISGVVSIPTDETYETEAESYRSLDFLFGGGGACCH